MQRDNHLSRHVRLPTVMLVLLWSMVLQAQTLNESVLIRNPVEQDVYAAGRQVEVLAEIQGDLVAAGQRIRVNAPILGDVIVAGESVDLQGSVADDVRAAGRQVVVTGEVGDHVVAVGEDVVLETGSHIQGWAWLAGESVRVSGHVGQYLKVAARRVIISGEVMGDVELIAEKIEILEGAHLHGDLIWRSEHAPQIEPGALLDGDSLERPLSNPLKHDDGSPIATSAFSLVSLLVTGAVFYWLFPSVPEQAAALQRRQPLFCLALGVAVLLTTPLLVLLLFITAVGALLGLALLASYLVTILLATVVGAFAVGELGWRLSMGRDPSVRTKRFAAFAVVLLLLAMLQFIPIIGSLIGLLVMLSGLGGLVMLAYRHRKPLTT